MENKESINVRVFRCIPQNGNDTGHYEEYSIPYQAGMTVLTALDYIYEHIDRSLSFYYSCRIGKCLGCFVDVDGKTVLACTTPLKDGMIIGPNKKHKLIKDVVVDFREG